MLWRLFLCVNLLAFGATDPLILPRPIQSNFADERLTPTQPGTLTISGATPEQLALARRVLLADGTLQHIDDLDLPVGLSLIGPRGSDSMLLAAAKRIGKVT